MASSKAATGTRASAEALLTTKDVAAHPLRRLSTPEDVAHAALFLAPSEPSWITGIILDVAGGGDVGGGGDVRGGGTMVR